jgi:hypothetical protein
MLVGTILAFDGRDTPLSSRISLVSQRELGLKSSTKMRLNGPHHVSLAKGAWPEKFDKNASKWASSFIKRNKVHLSEKIGSECQIGTLSLRYHRDNWLVAAKRS